MDKRKKYGKFVTLLICMLMVFNAGVFAQDIANLHTNFSNISGEGLEMPAFMLENVTIEAEQVPLRIVLSQLEKQVSVQFSYRDNVVDENKRYSINKNNVSLFHALSDLFRDTEINFMALKGGYIVLKKAPANEAATQDVTVEGQVVSSEDNVPLAGVTIIVQGTTTGTTTDEDGNYSITVPEDGTLVFSFVGFETQQIPVQGRSEINVQLEPSVAMMEEAVVTAFGLEREQRSLGQAVGKVTGEEIAETADINVANSLSGRVSGVQVSRASSGPGGSTRVIIRGNTSLGGNNQPLYVVDGVPIDNTNRYSAGRWGGYDRGDGIQNINPNDIEEISILKGPNAAALYGQRGANGVILITTKTGANREGIGVDINSKASFGEPWILPDFQNIYGLGNNGSHRFYNDGNGNIVSRSDWEAMGRPDWTPQITTINDGSESPVSWGPKMNGEQVYTWDGKLLPFTPQPNNVRDFYNTETTFENSISLSGGNETTLFRLSFANLQNEGLLRNHELQRNTINLRGSHQFTDKFSAEARINFVDQEVNQRPGLSDQQRNVAYVFRYMPRNTRLESLERYELTQEDINNPNALHGYSNEQLTEGWTRHWTNATFTEQPNWTVNNTTADDSRQRIMGHIALQYELSDWASLSAKAGVDTYTDRVFSFSALGTRVSQEGRIAEAVNRFREDNVEVLLSAERAVNEDITVSGNIGGNYLKNFYRSVGHNGRRFSVPNLIVISNTEDQRTNFGLSEFEIHSLFAFGQVNFRDYLYLDWTARNDWSSTLNPNNNSFFYPSVSSNFVWSDAFDLTNDILSYGSIRASWAQAGSSGDPYQLTGTYSLSNFTQAGQPLASFTNNIPLQDLQNELTTSVEVGTDLRFFAGRLRADFTYYNATTENQILNIAIAPSTGYRSKTINAGEINNRGIELLVSGTPIASSSGLQWGVTVNLGINRNRVVSLTEGVDRFRLGIDRAAIIFADPGKPYGEIYSAAARWLRDDEGNRLIDPSGLPIREPGQYRVGNAVPDWTGGITNSLRYKGFSLSALVDVSQGGIVVSQSNVVEAIHGTTKRTLEGRDGTLVAEGMAAVPDGNGGWTSTGNPNTVQVSAEDYWQRAVPGSEQSVAKEFTNDASYIAMREISLGYSFPKLAPKISVNSLRLSVIGRNLFYFERHTDGFSPEGATYNVSSSSLGLESASFPMTRSIGFNLNIGL